MSWKLNHSFETSCSSEAFYSGVDVWTRRPNVVNRKLLGAVVRLEAALSPVWHSLDHETLSHVTVKELHSAAREQGGSRMVVRELLPRLSHVQPSLDLVVSDCSNHSVSFFPLELPEEAKGQLLEARLCHKLAYRFMYETHTSKICLFLTEQYCAASAAGLVNGVTVPAADWLVGVLLPKILLWSNSQGQGGHSAMQLRQTLVPLDKYSCLYQRMKEKHGPALIKNWQIGRAHV